MDGGSIAKTPAATAASAPARTDVAYTVRGVETELTPHASVQQPGESEPIRFDQRHPGPAAALDAAFSDFVRRKIEIDPNTRDMVFQLVDRDTGRVIRQTPDEAILRLRAYVRELRAAQEVNSLLRVEKIV
jgi:flagellar protein FlaG